MWSSHQTAKRSRARSAMRIVELGITWCPVCSSRLGGVSVTASLRTVMRLPVQPIQAYFATLHGVKISTGEIVELLHRAKGHLDPLVAALKQEIRASPAVQADETGWREDGKNGYIWGVSTPSVRYDEYHHSRGSEVVKHLLGERFEGVLGSDFYASSTIHQGLQQRGFVHLLRDGHELKAQYPTDAVVQQWFTELKALYNPACSSAGPDPTLPPAKQEAARRQQQHACEQELMQLCAPYVRPLVIARKISGGTRRPHGSETRLALFSLFGSWAAEATQSVLPLSGCAFPEISLRSTVNNIREWEWGAREIFAKRRRAW
ncbi:MAG TPA: hypothetical protein DIU08_05310 [Ktedonobacter sp.]|nr:hypothetical protein [Ktedonobacter sp.]HCP74040.1 hypothetical protein [Ktedonobacter sp.]